MVILRTNLKAIVERAANPVDLHVGARIRMRRKTMGLSQERLAESLSLTFQQVQKYERGANRVSASKLYEIARSLRSPINYFFDGLADTVDPLPEGVADQDASAFVHELVMTPEGMELAALFPRIAKRGRKLVLDLARVLAEDDEQLDQAS
jgi:transcriptional regulator with XRE-family HTH domain